MASNPGAAREDLLRALGVPKVAQPHERKRSWSQCCWQCGVGMETWDDEPDCGALPEIDPPPSAELAETLMAAWAASGEDRAVTLCVVGKGSKAACTDLSRKGSVCLVATYTGERRGMPHEAVESALLAALEAGALPVAAGIEAGRIEVP